MKYQNQVFSITKNYIMTAYFKKGIYYVLIYLGKIVVFTVLASTISAKYFVIKGKELVVLNRLLSMG